MFKPSGRRPFIYPATLTTRRPCAKTTGWVHSSRVHKSRVVAVCKATYQHTQKPHTQKPCGGRVQSHIPGPSFVIFAPAWLVAVCKTLLQSQHNDVTCHKTQLPLKQTAGRRRKLECTLGMQQSKCPIKSYHGDSSSYIW